jgi:hypothetical protein
MKNNFKGFKKVGGDAFCSVLVLGTPSELSERLEILHNFL